MFEIGASLREARIRRGLTPADVQKAIRIRDRYLQALEEERWELLPGDAYVKGFMRTYADYLGLDGNLYVDEYNSRFAEHDDPAFTPAPLRRAPRAGSGGILRPLVVIGVIVVIVAAVAAWQLIPSSQKANNPPATTTVHTTTGHTTTSKKGRHHTRPAALPTRAVLAATRGACWLEIRQGSSSGTLLYENTLQQGQTQSVSLTKGPLWINVGDPPNLDIHMAGRIVPGLPKQAAIVLLTRKGLKAG